MHLAPMVDALESAWYRPTRRTGHAPPQHGKTDTELAFIAKTLELAPHLTLAYVTYEATTAKSKSRKARQWAEALGVKLADDANRLEEWRTTAGGGLIATGIGGPLTSKSVDILIIDDPYKNRQQAESAAWRQMVSEWYGDVAETRLPESASVFIFHTRWVNDDLIGHVRDADPEGWGEHILLSAVDDDTGAVLWPEKYTAEGLAKRKERVGPYTWASLYQGRPRPRGGSVFNGVTHYTSMPGAYRAAIGVDLAYSERTSRDWSISVVIAATTDGYFDVLDVQRKQVQAPEFGLTLKAHQSRFPGAPMRWYASGTEKGNAQFLNRAGIRVEAYPATSDKFLRAQPVAAAWNAGKVRVPQDAPWLEPFLGCVLSFTGTGDAQDDDVDALAAAFDAVSLTGTRVHSSGNRRQHDGHRKAW